MAGLRQQRRLPQFAGAGLQLAAAVAFLIGMTATRFAPAVEATVPIANATFMGALLIALAGFASAWAYRQVQNDSIAGLYYGWGLAWWVGNGVHEIFTFLGHRDEPDVLLAFAALTGWLAAEVHRRRPASALALTSLVALASAVPLALWQSDAHGQPFAGNGGWAWLVYAALGIRSLQCLRDGRHRLASAAQFTGGWCGRWWPSLLLGGCGQFDAWAMAGKRVDRVAWLLVAALALVRWRWLSMPLGEAFDAWRGRPAGGVFVVLGLGGWVAVRGRCCIASCRGCRCSIHGTRATGSAGAGLRWQVPVGGTLASSRIVLLSVWPHLDHFGVLHAGTTGAASYGTTDCSRRAWRRPA